MGNAQSYVCRGLAESHEAAPRCGGKILDRAQTGFRNILPEGRGSQMGQKQSCTFSGVYVSSVPRKNIREQAHSDHERSYLCHWSSQSHPGGWHGCCRLTESLEILLRGEINSCFWRERGNLGPMGLRGFNQPMHKSPAAADCGVGLSTGCTCDLLPSLDENKTIINISTI